MNLTEEDIKAIEKEAEEKYPTSVLINGEEYHDHYYSSKREAHKIALTQERIKAKALIELLRDIEKSLYVGEDLKDKEILEWYMEVVETVKEEITKAINSYNTKQIEHE